MIFLVFLPLVAEILIVIVFSLFITYLGFFVVRKKFSHEKLSEDHQVASYNFNAFSITYGVLLTFVVYANWSDYNKAEEHVSNETSYLSNLFRDSKAFPDSIRNIAVDKIINYTKAVIEDEWQMLARGETSPIADSNLNELWEYFTAVPVTSINNPYLYQLALERLNFISQARRLRILDMQQTTPTLIWIVLIICAVISFGYSYYFIAKKRKTHFILIAAFILINVLIFYLIYVLDHPFQGYAGITSDAFKAVLNKFVAMKRF